MYCTWMHLVLFRRRPTANGVPVVYGKGQDFSHDTPPLPLAGGSKLNIQPRPGVRSFEFLH